MVETDRPNDNSIEYSHLGKQAMVVLSTCHVYHI